MLAPSSARALLRRPPFTTGLGGQTPIVGASNRWLTTLGHRRQQSTATADTTANANDQDVASIHDNVEHQQWARQVLRDAVAAAAPRYTWSKEETAAIYHQPLMELAFQAVRYMARSVCSKLSLIPGIT